MTSFIFIAVIWGSSPGNSWCAIWKMKICTKVRMLYGARSTQSRSLYINLSLCALIFGWIDRTLIIMCYRRNHNVCGAELGWAVLNLVPYFKWWNCVKTVALRASFRMRFRTKRIKTKIVHWYRLIVIRILMYFTVRFLFGFHYYDCCYALSMFHLLIYLHLSTKENCLKSLCLCCALILFLFNNKIQIKRTTQ